jgi:phytoene synthase
MNNHANFRAAMQVINSRYAPVQSLVKDHDPDRYFLSLFAPREHRPALWTLFALNYEIAKTREVVNETRLGLIRLQWWRDEIARLYDGGASDAHEILMALRQVIDKYGLPKELFDTLIYGREFDLEDVLPETLEGTMTYIEHTNMPLTDLVRSILTPPHLASPRRGEGCVVLAMAKPSLTRSWEGGLQK